MFIGVNIITNLMKMTSLVLSFLFEKKESMHALLYSVELKCCLKKNKELRRTFRESFKFSILQPSLSDWYAFVKKHKIC